MNANDRAALYDEDFLAIQALYCLVLGAHAFRGIDFSLFVEK